MAATVTRIWCITASSSRRRAAMVPGLAGTVEEIDSERILESDAAPVNRVSRRAGLWQSRPPPRPGSLAGRHSRRMPHHGGRGHGQIRQVQEETRSGPDRHTDFDTALSRRVRRKIPHDMPSDSLTRVSPGAGCKNFRPTLSRKAPVSVSGERNHHALAG